MSSGHIYDLLPSAASPTGPLNAPLQKKCACGQTSAACQDEHKNLTKGEDVPPAVHDVVRGGGQPLEPETRVYMESRFGQDFSHVRVHHDAAAAHSARAVDAQAFTVGNHLVFDAGRYDPSTLSGKRLLAHELAHTVQQQRGAVGSEHAAEKDADRAANRAEGDAPVMVAEPSGEKRLQRQPNPNQKAGATADPKDEGHDKIVEASKQTTGDPAKRAQHLVDLMVTRYYPEYLKKVASVVYDEKEPTVRVDIKETNVGGKKTQSATIKVGKKFVEGISGDTLRERIEELSIGLSRLTPEADPKAPAVDIVWRIIHDKFPKKANRPAGTSYDANLPGLLTDFKSGNVQVGTEKKSWSGPRIFFGKAFAALPDGDKEAKVSEELDKIDKWSVENARLVSTDLADSDITSRIRGLNNTQLMALRDKVKDSTVKDYVDSLLTVSTPMEEGLTKQIDGSLSVVIGNVTIAVDVDTRGTTSPNTQAETPSNITVDPANIPSFHYDKANKVDQFAGYSPQVKIKVQTTYQSLANRDFTQGYGKGTTPREKELGATSIRYHEGSHGLDIVRFARANPFPEFTGKVGDTKTEFEQKIKDYVAARAAYAKHLQNFTDVHDECPGTTIDAFMSAKDPKWKKLCP